MAVVMAGWATRPHTLGLPVDLPARRPQELPCRAAAAGGGSASLALSARALPSLAANGRAGRRCEPSPADGRRSESGEPEEPEPDEPGAAGFGSGGGSLPSAGRGPEEVLSLPVCMHFFPNSCKEVGAVQGVSITLLRASVTQSRAGMLEELRRCGLRLRLVGEHTQVEDLQALARRLVGSCAATAGTLTSLASQCPLSEDNVVLSAVRQDGLALAYAVEELRRHPQVLQEALLQNSGALKLRSEASPFVNFNACFFRGCAEPELWATLSSEEREARYLAHVAHPEFERRLSHYARNILVSVNEGPRRPFEEHERREIRRSFYNALGMTVQFFRTAPSGVKYQKAFLPVLLEHDLKCLLGFRRACSQKQLASGVRLPFEEVMTNEELRQIITDDFWRPLRMVIELSSHLAQIAEDALSSLDAGDDVELLRIVSKAGLRRVDPFQALLINEDLFDNLMEVDFLDMFAVCEANLEWVVWLLRRALRAGGRSKYYTYTHILEASRQTAVAWAFIFLWIFSLSFVSGVVLLIIATHWSSAPPSSMY